MPDFNISGSAAGRSPIFDRNKLPGVASSKADRPDLAAPQESFQPASEQHSENQSHFSLFKTLARMGASVSKACDEFTSGLASSDQTGATGLRLSGTAMGGASGAGLQLMGLALQNH